MRPVVALRLPVQVDLAGFIALLQRLQVQHRVTEDAGEQVLWVPAEPVAEQVRGLYARYPQGDAGEPLAVPPHNAAGSLLARLRGSPLTSAVLLLTLLVALVTWGGENLQAVRWLSFLDFSVQGDYLQFYPLASSLAQGQWWRLVSPVLLHFGLLHLAMNSLWWWELGRRIELRQGGLALFGLLLFYGLVSDLAQFLWSGPGLFGGLSGVLYGLLGHCWIYQKLAPNAAYRLPPGVVGMMLLWLLICMTGIFELVQLAAIANAAHLGGLLAGCLTGLLGGALARWRR
ncbi:rhomboid family intramembrane serine protease [Pseudomonas sp. N040]|uniref:rhomboid family intramembrane serine protease n=1 Tax=Pseudomonas sp. N040 TaxID=2785325 RepID=UPI0018A2CC89|nr:rhomboid family intramembrane serine protease [Pseudomonas sp. N040]MBF7729283.1 rhomboid family intramembrane serine protease [Pseudomonas sp. N040]MBW7012923.1 rhomboid family intramembrane serine protease [Pseudomonas sp. N040]